MAAYHHEWWNGQGYPYGISGEEIPLCARIMAVADVFDALTSKRCYKNAMPLEKAYAIVREKSGTHFDPEVVAAFFDAEEHIEKWENVNKAGLRPNQSISSEINGHRLSSPGTGRIDCSRR